MWECDVSRSYRYSPYEWHGTWVWIKNHFRGIKTLSYAKWCPVFKLTKWFYLLRGKSVAQFVITQLSDQELKSTNHVDCLFAGPDFLSIGPSTVLGFPVVFLAWGSIKLSLCVCLNISSNNFSFTTDLSTRSLNRLSIRIAPLEFKVSSWSWSWNFSWT